MSDAHPSKPPRSNVAHRLAELGELVLADEMAFTRRGRWRDFFRERIGSGFDDTIFFDIGCANAEFLAQIAQIHPDSAFVGLDWKYKSILDAGQRVRDLALNNLVFIRGRGQDVSRIFSVHELNEVWLFHPDPSARLKEIPNRIINDRFMIDLHQTLMPRARFCIKTDHAGYFQWILSLLGLAMPAWFSSEIDHAPRVRRCDLLEPQLLPGSSSVMHELFDVIHHSPDFWHDERALELASGHPFGHAQTPYEARFVRKRFPIYYVELQAR